MTIDFDTIIKHFKENPELNFIGLAVTIQQANAIDACIVQFKEKGICLKGFVLLLKHAKTGRGLTKDCFTSCLDNNIVVTDFNNEFKTIKIPRFILGRCFVHFLANHSSFIRTVYVAATGVNFTWLYLFEQQIPSCKVHSVLLDDGGGSYANPYKNTLDYALRDAPNAFKVKTFVKTYLRVFIQKQLTKRLSNAGRVIDNRLFFTTGVNGKTKFFRNAEIAKCYHKVFLAFRNTIPKDVIKQFENCVVINTQCLEENNITQCNEDYLLYEEFVTCLKECNVSMVIKPHPRELNKKKYIPFGIPVYTDVKYSQEVIVAATAVKPICVVSIFSSTLLNIYGIFNVPAISLAKIIRRYPTIDILLKNQLDDYIEQYSGTVEFPDTIPAAVQRIQGLMRRE